MIKKEKLGKLCKERMIDEIISRIKERPNFILTSYMGSSVSDLESLRRNLGKSSSSYVVVKNSMLKVVLEKLKLESEISKIDSGMGVSLSGDDILSTCKTVVTFAKDHDKFKIKGAIIDGKAVASEKVKELAMLPPRDVLLARVVGGIKAPITGFVNTLGGILRKFVYVVEAIKVNKESAGTAPDTGTPAETKA